jgi:hypothetical protein
MNNDYYQTTSQKSDTIKNTFREGFILGVIEDFIITIVTGVITILGMVLLVKGDISVIIFIIYGIVSITVLSLIIYIATRIMMFLLRILKNFRSLFDKEQTESTQRLHKSYQYRLLKIASLIFGDKIKKDTFEPIVADWQEEYFEALFKKEIWKARWINVRYTYGFTMAMWQKSPLGDLLEYVRKIAS